ncbi:MAG: hypothetical protein VKJ06_04620 [Vampirovibrionales bacterium]|nr:hypothetical protein [Vampirovibrionales bacterium]
MNARRLKRFKAFKCFKSLKNSAQKGSAAVYLIAIALLGFLLAGLTTDIPYYFAVRNQMLTASQAGALAGAGTLFKSTAETTEAKQTEARNAVIDYASENFPLVANNGDIIFGFVDPSNPTSFSTTPSGTRFQQTGGYNAVKVNVVANESNGNSNSNNTINTFFGQMLGVNSVGATVSSVAMIDNRVTSITGGLRPIYGCQAHWQASAADGDLTDDVVRIYGDHFELNGSTISCPTPTSGNWGFADLRDCAPGVPGGSTTEQWLESGYSGTVTLGQCYSTQTGNFIPSVSDTLDTLIADETVFAIPLINTFTGSGSNSTVIVSGFTGFQITGYRANGNASGRYIEGRFTATPCTVNTCSTSDSVTTGFGVGRLKLVG